jgi:hypothetical protein
VRPAPLVLLAALLTACSGGEATRPSDTTPSTPTIAAGDILTVRSGEDQRPVAGATVTIGGRSSVTDSVGHVTLAAPVAVETPVEIAAPSFLLRQTLLRTRSEVFTLWPDRPGFDATFTREMFYAEFSVAGTLIRPTTPITVVPPAALREAAVVDAARNAAALVTAANGGAVPYTVADLPAQGSVTVDLALDPSDPYFAANPGSVGHADVQTVDNRVTSARVVLEDVASARLARVIAHELGHTFGAGHPSQRGLMNVAIPDLQDFSDAEKLAFHMSAQRRPGNAFPDDDRAVRASGTPL